ncbi:MAG: hypothetical protein V4691_10405 [Pseudomonadota bacterium]
MFFPMNEFFSFDLVVHALLLLCVVVAPWAIVTSGLRTSMHVSDLSSEEKAPRHSILMSRFQSLG